MSLILSNISFPEHFTQSSSSGSTAVPFSLPTANTCCCIYRQTQKEQNTKEAQRENRKRDAMGNSVIEIGMPDT
jgi:hypothetical protein